MSLPMLGCIADDFTGGTDLTNNLVRAGMRALQTIGVSAGPLDFDVDAVVVALKSRTIAPAEAVDQSLDARRWPRAQDVRQVCFKYCSTFDSTPRGNIGPVTEALMNAIGCDFTIATPAFPDKGCTVFKGYLFVCDLLLSESGMKDHPLMPMNDANLVRVLQAQCRRKVGLVDHTAAGVGIAVVDAVSSDDPLRLGPALSDMPLVIAGSGVAIVLPTNFGLAPSTQASRLPAAAGLKAVVSGSCYVATNTRAGHFIANGRPVFAIDPLRLAAGEDVTGEALEWAAPLLAGAPRPPSPAPRRRYRDGSASRRQARYSNARSRPSRAGWSNSVCAS